MPTYEYECTKCKYTFEEFQKITDEPLKKCPKCRSKLRRIITGGVGLIFKGNGFYVTDYKKSNLPMIRDKKKKDLQKVLDKPKPLVKKEPNQ
ncbi:zinc ribbon domain-containing protein [candidate division WOR-3 bacterium]|jgi:putative FmdB family regulatory protein|nr:zinc ribbon domain-containing protein [candidate division WOR-3 bacterium]